MRHDKFRGCLLGVMYGDVLGAPVEGLGAAEIARRHGRVRGPLTGPDGIARYTDDTQLTLALARALVAYDGEVDPAACAAAAAEAFDPQRGYGRSATLVLQALRAGADWRTLAERQFPGGSYGNGASMRIAPLALLYGGAPEPRLRRAVSDAVRATHVHPEAIEGAVLLARVIGRALALEGQARRLSEVLPELRRLVREPELIVKIDEMTELTAAEASEETARVRLGTGVRTRDSVPLAIFLALRYAAEPVVGLLAAVNAGGDADTIAAMTGAVLGALHGESAFPDEWRRTLESGPDGVDELLGLADRLAELERPGGLDR